ncbi:glycosyl transferase family 4 [Pseudohalioglobus sediminis]|uniref:Glycosyl transferase family 4 n=1 Tax=Pseudohalioglobus sediminis TaxID=2606449 RepID=A0A5B0X1B9_9GAMM|nr:glycosyl transferase family 4 [Pseudohalioglobus sediminis]KAA1192428.1 glycosyl transferase family 4 [Pseudohalioglobus sediminis]
MTASLMTMALSALMCLAYLLLARRWRLVAQPNERSSHQVATPHGGGVPLFLAVFAGAWLASLGGIVWTHEYLAVLGVTAALVVIGVVDDMMELSSGRRLVLYAVCCLVAVDAVQPFLAAGISLQLLVGLLLALGLLWLVNLYNFMDGIDAFAAMQCILACGGAVLLAWQQGADPAYLQMCLLLAAAHAGFLFWNWPPARLFLGDAGSVPTGFLLGAMALLGASRGYLPLAAWLILLGWFIVDASVTLAWRIASGQPFTQPHRLHAYQRLSRYLGGHLPVVFILLAVNTLWLFPLAWFATVQSKYVFLLVILAYVPLLAGVAKVAKLG